MIGTAAMIGIALGTAGAQTAASIYNSKKASGVNEKALATQERSDRDAMAFERENAARQDAFAREEADRRDAARKELMAVDQQRWQDYLRANEPMWRRGGEALGNLYDLAGMGRGNAVGPDINALMASGPPPSGSTPIAGAPPAQDVGVTGGGHGQALYRATREPIRMAMENTGGGLGLQELMMLAGRHRAPQPTA